MSKYLFYSYSQKLKLLTFGGKSLKVMHIEDNHQSCIFDCGEYEQSLRVSTVKVEEEIEALGLRGFPPPPPFLLVLNITSISKKEKTENLLEVLLVMITCTDNILS